MRRCQTTNKGRGFCGWVKLELKQGLDLVSAEVNKVHEKGEIYNFAEAVVKIKFSRQNATSAAAEM
jgi:hypothetical protein